MTYIAPYIDDTGCHTNTYSDILNHLIDRVKSIYGEDIYLGVDSMDYQLLSVFARAIYEDEQCSQMNYQSKSPATVSTKDAMASLLTLNGLLVKTPTYSTVSVTLTGIPYTTINGGVVQSTSGDKWNLPQTVVIGSSGTITVVATAQELGDIKASIGTVTQIITPTYGWNSVTNNFAASAGQAVETLTEMKERQKNAVAIPSRTPVDSVYAGLYSTDGVEDVVIYENDTSSSASYNTEEKTGGPANSITCVVKGGNDNDIATSISLRKTPGCYLAGNVTVSIKDRYGNPNTIRFYRPSDTSVYITFTIKALSGYSSAVGDQIKQAIVDYVSKLGIGNNLYISQIWEAILSVSPDIKPYFSLKSVVQGTSQGSQSDSDLTASFNTQYTTSVENISLVLSS